MKNHKSLYSRPVISIEVYKEADSYKQMMEEQGYSPDDGWVMLLPDNLNSLKPKHDIPYVCVIDHTVIKRISFIKKCVLDSVATITKEQGVIREFSRS